MSEEEIGPGGYNMNGILIVVMVLAFMVFLGFLASHA
jgi:hypothetical protein